MNNPVIIGKATLYNMDCMGDLECGKAGEYLVCADLIIKGYVAFPSEQGLPYDVVMEANGKLLKVQVKTTRKSKSIPQRKTDIPAYIFHIGNNGKLNRRKKYEASQVDIFALVALDTRRIAYLPYFNSQTTMNFRVPELRGNYHDEQGVKIQSAVLELFNNGVSCGEIAKLLNMKISNVYKYTSVDITQKGTNAGVYFDEFTIEKALEGIANVA